MTTTPNDARRSRQRLLVASAVALTVLTLLTATAVLASTSDGSQPPTPPAASSISGSAGVPAVPTTASSRTATPADPAAALEQLAAAVADGPADPLKAKFEYIETRVWESYPAPTETTLGSGPGRHTRHWTTGLGISRTVVIDEGHGCPPESDDADDDLGPFDGPLSTHPDAVRRQILHEPLPPDAAPDVFGQVGMFYRERFVPLATRQGVLRMLARLPGIGVQLNVTDALGRAGFAVTWTYRSPMPFTVDKTLIFSTSGQLLAGHSRAHRRPDATTPPDPMDEYEIYTLQLMTTYTPNTDTPKITCP